MTPAERTLRAAQPPWSKWVWWGIAVATAFMVIHSVLTLLPPVHRADYFTLAMTGVVVCCFILALHFQRKDVVTDQDGTHRPGARDIPWADVAYVCAPRKWDHNVVVAMTSGADKRTGFPPAYAERLAELGNKPLR